MIKKLFSWALACLTATAVSAQTDSLATSVDTINYYLNLGEVTVKAHPTIRKSDRLLLLPTSEQRLAATGGTDLLRRMNLPRVSVSPLSGEITLNDGGNIVLCINGVKATSKELDAVSPDDILRIEYHDSPGARYGDADAVVDYILRKRQTGGNVSARTFECFGNGFASMDVLALRHSVGRSEVSANASYMGMKRKSWVRDYEETRHYPNATVTRNEVGQPVDCDMRNLISNLNYSYIDKNRLFVNAKLGFVFSHIPADEESDRRNTLYISDGTEPVNVYEHSTERSVSPSLDLYIQRDFSNGQQFVFNTTATYIDTNSSRIYQESRAEDTLTDIFSDIDGSKYSLNTEAFYERKIGKAKLTTGLRHMQAYTLNRYGGTVSESVTMRLAESSVYAEWQGNVGKLGYMANLTGTRISYGQADIRIVRTALQPSVRLSYVPCADVNIKYSGKLRTVTPQLAEISDVEQVIDAGMVRRGNPELTPFRMLDNSLSAGYTSTLVSLDVNIGCRYERNPIMESVVCDNDMLVRTCSNQRSFTWLKAETTLSVRLWREHITLSVTPQMNRYISCGNDYTHTQNMLKLEWNVDFCLADWTLQCSSMVGPANRMYGERRIEERNMSIIMVGYKRPSWWVQLGIFNPFQRTYHMNTYDYAALAPSFATAHTSANRYLAVKMGFNISYGRKGGNANRRLNYEDTDAGIMKGSR